MPGMPEIAAYKFCPQCGGRLATRLIKPLEPERLVCSGCGHIFYLDPKLSVIAVIPMAAGVVMVRRDIDPGHGLWVLPGGFVDRGEVVEEAVVRETQEETHLNVRPLRLLNMYSYPDHPTVVAAFVTEYVSGELSAGDETLEARVFALNEIPWPRLAFPATREALLDYIRHLSDLKK
jgi:ADP-ribose pyrophosphatase YjhB (NUDIX family)